MALLTHPTLYQAGNIMDGRPHPITLHFPHLSIQPWKSRPPLSQVQEQAYDMTIQLSCCIYCQALRSMMGGVKSK